MEDDINKLIKETESLQKQLLRKEVVLMEQTQSQANFKKEIEESQKRKALFKSLQ